MHQYWTRIVLATFWEFHSAQPSHGFTTVALTCYNRATNATHVTNNEMMPWTPNPECNNIHMLERTHVPKIFYLYFLRLLLFCDMWTLIMLVTTFQHVFERILQNLIDAGVPDRWWWWWWHWWWWWWWWWVCCGWCRIEAFKRVDKVWKDLQTWPNCAGQSWQRGREWHLLLSFKLKLLEIFRWNF